VALIALPLSSRAASTFLIDQTARRHGVVIPEDERGAQLGHLVRDGCTPSPDACLFAVIDRAVIAVSSKLPNR
jgi:hypothetical protein